MSDERVHAQGEPAKVADELVVRRLAETHGQDVAAGHHLVSSQSSRRSDDASMTCAGQLAEKLL